MFDKNSLLSCIERFLILAFASTISACISPPPSSRDSNEPVKISAIQDQSAFKDLITATAPSVVEINAVRTRAFERDDPKIGYEPQREAFFHSINTRSGVVVEHQGERFILTSSFPPNSSLPDEVSDLPVTFAAIAIIPPAVYRGKIGQFVWDAKQADAARFAGRTDSPDMHTKSHVLSMEKLITIMTPFISLPKYGVSFFGPIRGNKHLVPAKILNAPLESYYTPELPIFIWGAPYGTGMAVLAGNACENGSCLGAISFKSSGEGGVEVMYHNISIAPGQLGGPIFSGKDGSLIGIANQFQMDVGGKTSILPMNTPIRAFWGDFVKEYDARKMQAITSGVGRPCRNCGPGSDIDMSKEAESFNQVR